MFLLLYKQVTIMQFQLSTLLEMTYYELEEVVLKMPMFIKDSYFFVRPDQKRYEIASNYANYIELGIAGVTPYYLEAKIENDEFKISGVLLNATGEVLCQLKDNFVITSAECTKEMTIYGYRIKNSQGSKIFEIRVENNVCHLEGTIYSISGEIAAVGKEGTFVIIKGPAIVGKLNNSIGLKIG